MSTRRSPRLFRRSPPVAPAPRHLWAHATGTTADGVVVLLQVELTVRDAVDAPHHADPDELDRAVMDATEDHLRGWISGHSVAALPTAGAAVDWVPADLVPGAAVEHVFVMACDIEVTPQLQRLMGGSVGP
jgi:hypothetical protein